MFICSTLLIVSFVSICCIVITEEIDHEGSSTTISNFCKNPEDVPLFGNTSCISPALYTGLFLTSIILSGITFLMLISLLIMLCIRRLIRPHSDCDELSMTDLADPNNSKVKTTVSPTKPDKSISSVLRRIVSTSPLEGLSQKHLHHSFPIPTLQESLLSSSSNSYSHSIGERRNAIQTVSESCELTTRQSTQRSSLNRNDSSNSFQYPRKYSTKF